MIDHVRGKESEITLGCLLLVRFWLPQNFSLCFS